MFFKKKPETVETLSKKCDKKFDEFLGHLTKAHYKSYYEFKLQLKDDMLGLMNTISQERNEETAFNLLQHLHKQLEFITKNPFSADQKDFDEFINSNYPYRKQMDEITNKNIGSTKPKLK